MIRLLQFTRRAVILCSALAIASAFAWLAWPTGCGPGRYIPCIIESDSWVRARYDAGVPMFVSHDDLFAAADTADPSREVVLKEVFDGVGVKASRRIRLWRETPELTCAVVGNSGNLRGSGYGPLIDSHDVVVRMNNAPVDGFKDDVGSRTSISLVQTFTSSMRHYDGDTVYLFIVNDTNMSSEDPETVERYRTTVRGDVLSILAGLRTTLEAVSGSVKIIEGIEALEGRLLFLSAEFVRYIGTRWFTPPSRGQIDHPSTGLKAFVLAMHLCGRISLFGFGADTAAQRWDHYFSAGQPLQSFPSRHRYEYQEQLLGEFEAHRLLRRFKGNERREARSRP